MTLNELAKEAGENAKAHGFWEPDPGIPGRLMLIVSEASELLEHHRSGERPDDLWFHVPLSADRTVAVATEMNGVAMKNKPDGIPAELADIIIRCLDFAYRYEIDIERAVRLKMEYNKSRPFKHGRTM